MTTLNSMLKSKITGIAVTDCNVTYEGSISIDVSLMRRANIMEYEQVHVLDRTNGERFITYAIKGSTGQICINGAAALLVKKGDDLIILTYHITDEFIEPTIVRAKGHLVKTSTDKKEIIYE